MSKTYPNARTYPPQRRFGCKDTTNFTYMQTEMCVRQKIKKAPPAYSLEREVFF